MKNNRMSKYCGFAVAALMLAGTGQVLAQTADLTINTFDSNANNTGHEWGSGTQAWDGTVGNPPGSLLVTADFSNSSDTPVTTYICLNGNPWYVGTPINFSTYQAMEFDIKWDNTSDINIGEFNDVSTIPLTQTNAAGLKILNTNLNAGQITGLEIDYCGGPQGQLAPLVINTNIPAAASNGWVHMVIPINAAEAGIDGCSGFVFHKWVSQYSSQITNDFQGRFWIDNVILKGTAGPPPPPTVNVPVKATPGLALTAVTGPYNRENIESVNDQGFLGASGPVSYSFTIAKGVNGVGGAAFQNHLFLAPSPGTENDPDWSETNVIFVDLESTSTGGELCTFRYKTNLPNGNSMIYNTNVVPASINASTPNGTWTVTFSGTNNITMSGPGGVTTNFTIPAASAALFTSPVKAYFGCQAGNQGGIGQQAILSEIKITGTANPLDEVFTTESTVNPNNWTTNAADSTGVMVVPTNAAFWFTWTLPDTGFGLIGSTNLTALTWQDVPGTILSLSTKRAALVTQDSLPNGGTAYYRLIKRNFTQLQILLPGETNAPNTLTGKTGSPTPISLGATSGQIAVVINAVDPTWHVISSAYDTVHLTTTDSTGITPLDASMANGTLTQQLVFGQTGSFTVTASDTTNTNILSNTSSPITVNP